MSRYSSRVSLRRLRNRNPTLSFGPQTLICKLFSLHACQSAPNNPLIPFPTPPPALLPQNPNPDPNPSLLQSDFTVLCDLLTSPCLPSGPPLESALDRTGIEPGPSLLQAVFEHLDSSPKPLLTLFLWAKKRPGFEFSVSVFNSMINVLGKARQFDSAWSLLLDHVNGDHRPCFDSKDTFAILIRRYARAGKAQPAIRTFEFACKEDLIQDPNSKVSLLEILLDSLCKEGHVRVASGYLDTRRRLDPSWVPSVRVYNILLNGWFRSRKLKKVEQLWLEMRKENVMPTVVTYGTLVEGYCRMRRVERAMDLVDEMRKEAIEPNVIVYNPIIDALGEEGKFKEALGMIERFLLSKSGPTISTYNSLVKGFCKAGDLAGASRIIRMMTGRGFVPTPTTYNYFFRYFSKFGKIEEGMNLYTKMVESGYMPDRLTYHLLIKMLCEQERLDLAVQITKEMRARGCDLDLASSTMLVHLLCKLHKFKEAFAEFEDMTRRGIVPQFLTFQRLDDELKKRGMTELARKLRDLMASVPHSMNLPNNYVVKEDASRARKMSIVQKAKEMSDILKTCKDPRELIKRRGSSENAVSSANKLIDEFKRRANET